MPFNLSSDQLAPQNCALSSDDVRRVIAEAMKAGQFFAGPSLQLRWSHENEEVFWEIFNGRVLDRAQTRQRRRFEAWNLREVDPAIADAEPMLSVKFDPDSNEVHVTRSILAYAWEAFDDETGAIQSRETVKRNREWIGTLPVQQFSSHGQLLEGLTALIFLAVVGTSRLPLTSEESPHPAFTFGQWMYCYRANSGATPCTDPYEWITGSLRAETPWQQKAKLLEFAIRTSAKVEIDTRANHWLAQWQSTGHDRADLLRLVRALFEEISLSPYTDFVTKFLGFIKACVGVQYISLADEADFLTFQLRLLWRHLNAFDLIRFHHRGANYPDALLLEELLRRLFELADSTPELFLPRTGDTESDSKQKQLRRRGLRLGWLLRCQYAGLAVPELPTSPGENSRVLPAPYHRLPDDEILKPERRTHHLFQAKLPLPEAVGTILSRSFVDLNDADELQELGTALFLDRPLGIRKRPGEPDRTPLLSYFAFSRKLARERLQQLGRCAGMENLAPHLEMLDRRLESPEFSIGVAWRATRPNQRPGVASLEDALLVSDDFAFLKTTHRSLRDFLGCFDLTPLEALGLKAILSPGKCLVLRDEHQPDQLWVYDERCQNRLLLRTDTTQGFVSRPGLELPQKGLEALTVGEEAQPTPSIHLWPK
jgi:hypothetical protein